MANMFDENGNYNKTEWKPGDRITAGKLNKIEESLEAINNNDIERHKEADERLDALEEQNEAVEERFDELEDLVADNKSEVDTSIYEVHSKMDRLETKLDDGIDTVEAIAHIVDDKIADADANMKAQVAEADASMKAQVAEAEDIVDQGKADINAIIDEVEKISDLEAINEQLVVNTSNINELNINNVVFYGALGQNDDYTNEIKQAIENCEGELFFKKGIYIISDTITINKKVNIRCDNDVLIINKCSNKHLFDILADDCVIDNLSIQTDNYSHNCADININSNNTKIINCKLNGRNHSGIKVQESATNTVIDKCSLKDYAFMIYIGTAGHTRITNCFFTGGSTRSDVTYDGWTIEATGDGIKMTNKVSSNVVISSNTFDGCYRDAVDAFSSSGRIIISNNIIKNIETVGLDVKVLYRNDDNPWGSNIIGEQLTRVNITDNIFENVGIAYDSSAINMTYVDDKTDETVPSDDLYGPNYFNISNNIIDKCIYGIKVNNSKHTNINNNIITNYKLRAIWVKGVDSINIIGNNIEILNPSTNPTISITGGGNRINIFGNSIRGIVGDSLNNTGIGVTDNPKLLNISHNLISNFKVGLDIIAVNANIQGNNIFNCTTTCIKTNSSTMLNISSNTFTDSARDILFSADTNGVACFNNLSINVKTPLSNKSSVTNFNEGGNITLKSE